MWLKQARYGIIVNKCHHDGLWVLSASTSKVISKAMITFTASIVVFCYRDNAVIRKKIWKGAVYTTETNTGIEGGSHSFQWNLLKKGTFRSILASSLSSAWRSIFTVRRYFGHSSWFRCSSTVSRLDVSEPALWTWCSPFVVEEQFPLFVAVR